MLKLWFASALAFVAISVLGSVSQAAPITPTSTGNCSGVIFKNAGISAAFTAPTNQRVTGICLWVAGATPSKDTILRFDKNGEALNGCYQLAGIGTSFATVTKIKPTGCATLKALVFTTAQKNASTPAVTNSSGVKGKSTGKTSSGGVR